MFWSSPTLSSLILPSSLPLFYHSSLTLLFFSAKLIPFFSSFLSFSVGHSQQLEQLHHPVKTSYEGWGTACCVPCVLRGRLPPTGCLLLETALKVTIRPPFHAMRVASVLRVSPSLMTRHTSFELLRNSDVRQCLVGQTSTGKKKKHCVTKLMWVTGKNISKCDKANVSMQMSLICCPYRPFQGKKKQNNTWTFPNYSSSIT